MRKFDLQKSFHHRGVLIHAGIYQVPKYMSEEVAEIAKRDDMGDWVPEPKAATAAPAKPEEKALSGAPENKALGGGAAAQTFPAAGSSKRVEKGNRGGHRAVTEPQNS